MQPPCHFSHSAETEYSNLTCSVDASQTSSLTLLDVSSASATVDYCELLLSYFQFYQNDLLYCVVLPDRSQTSVYDDRQTAAYPVACSVPQGSVLGPLEVVVCTEDVINVTRIRSVSTHPYADTDDMQSYANLWPRDILDIRHNVTFCVTDDAVLVPVVRFSSTAAQCQQDEDHRSVSARDLICSKSRPTASRCRLAQEKSTASSSGVGGSWPRCDTGLWTVHEISRSEGGCSLLSRLASDAAATATCWPWRHHRHRKSCACIGRGTAGLL